MTKFQFQQVDVFTNQPLKGNPLAVVAGADALSDAQMQAFANWTNLSETTFLLKASSRHADYRVRIFTPSAELPFAGHPTLGSCHVWLTSGGRPREAEIIQECGAGLIRIRRDESRLAFAAPPLVRSGKVDDRTLGRIAKILRVPVSAFVASNWVDNGPGWVGVMLGTREEVLALKPEFSAMSGLNIGVVAPSNEGEFQFEVRAFVPELGVPEDPVTGSLNAGLAQWFFSAGLAPGASYVVSQGTVLGRAGRIHVNQDGPDIWVGGNTVTCISGTVNL